MGDPIKFMVDQGSDFKAGPSPITGQTAMSDVLSQYLSSLPGIYNATGGGVGTLSQAELDASKATTGGYNQLALQQLQQYGAPLMAEQGKLAQQAKGIEDSLNPEFAAIRSAAGTQTGNLLNSVNLNGLSEGERAAVERSLNQSNYATGNLGLDNATNAVQNAMSYGDRMSGKRQELSNYINTAGGFMGASQPTQFGGASPMLNNQTSSDVAAGVGQGTLGNLGGTYTNQQNLLADYNWKNSDRWAASDIGKNMGSMCCFIFLEATNGKLPWYVRAERDYYYQQEPAIAAGYKKMAKWLVPLMKKSATIKYLVNLFMVLPLTHVGGYSHMTNNTGWLLSPVKKLWFNIWKAYGTR
jgi:hypothetical protein